MLCFRIYYRKLTLLSKILVLSLALVSIKHTTVAQDLLYPSLINKLYKLSGSKTIWFLQNEQSHQLRLALRNALDSSVKLGLKKNKYHYDEVNQIIDKSFEQKDSIAEMQADRLFTDAAISYCKDIYEGADINDWMAYDELSSKQEDKDNNFLLNGLIYVTSSMDLISFFDLLEPDVKEYNLLKNELQAWPDSLSHFQKQQLITSLSFYRWIHHFNFEKYIVVNIASATLRYYEFDSIKLRMKIVVGKPSTRTPRFAAHCNQVILYPYWNVPTSIALNELLPQFKRNLNDIDILNMQLLDIKGNVVDHHKLNWQNYSKGYFPFRIRQSTGCDNSLGVIKFNLTSPLGVYLHDTNNKVAFLSGRRYYSHGCIRVEQPIELANYLLPNKIDSAFLESCLKDQLPVVINLERPVPVFVIYQSAETNFYNKVVFYKDIYSLLK
jgi:murein L,D-transpeptidase YcbB/YkuD